MIHRTTVYTTHTTVTVRVSEEDAMRALDDWSNWEQRSADAMAEFRTSYAGGESPYFPEEFYVRQVAGLDPETGRAKTVAYRFHDLTNIVTVQEKSEAPA